MHARVYVLEKNADRSRVGQNRMYTPREQRGTSPMPCLALPQVLIRQMSGTQPSKNELKNKKEIKYLCYCTVVDNTLFAANRFVTIGPTGRTYVEVVFAVDAPVFLIK